MLTRACGPRWLLPLAAALGLAAPAQAQSVYRYQDESGGWVFTDRQPEPGRAFEQSDRRPGPVAEPIARVARVATDEGIELRASNECLCPVEVAVRVRAADNLPIAPGTVVRAVIPPVSTVSMAAYAANDVDRPVAIEFEQGFVPGDPDATHRPPAPYRPPFAAASAWPVSQAWPDAVTHDTLDSEYAVDIAMPEQTGVFAARAGVVVALVWSNFRGGADREALGARANTVRILHDDGTFGLYAHLSWDSLRVRPGQRVARGEYIADSGNTGFSTGPHLHFAVLRNAGGRLVSEPVVFAGPGGSIEPTTGSILRNP